MKKLNKLQINPDKLMRNEELVALKVGYSGAYIVYRRDSIDVCAGNVTDSNDLNAKCDRWPSV